MKSILIGFGLLFSSFIVMASPVNVNHASAEEISKSLTGIGLAKAQAIVAYRDAHGAFKTPQDLTQVKGIGEKTVEKNLADILLEDQH